MSRSSAQAGDFDPSTALFDPTPLLRDTTEVRADGYTVLRFVADNPGTWQIRGGRAA